MEILQIFGIFVRKNGHGKLAKVVDNEVINGSFAIVLVFLGKIHLKNAQLRPKTCVLYWQKWLINRVSDSRKINRLADNRVMNGGYYELFLYFREKQFEVAKPGSRGKLEKVVNIGVPGYRSINKR